jgi:hypothetical protein
MHEASKKVVKILKMFAERDCLERNCFAKTQEEVNFKMHVLGKLVIKLHTGLSFLRIKYSV